MTKISIKSGPHCSIAWDGIDTQEWDASFRRISRSTILQARDYGDAMARLNHQRAVRGVISIGGEQAGLVQILEAGILGNAVQGVILDRGPMWFEGFGSEADFGLFLSALRRRYPKRFGRRMRFIPEMSGTPAVLELMRGAQFRRTGDSGYQTLWLDIRPDMEILRSSLEKKWRAALKKGEGDPALRIEWDVRGVYLDYVLKYYGADKALKGYSGASPETIKALASAFVRGENMLIGVAVVDNRPVAAIVIFIHGSSATYQAGYTSVSGREKCAHHVLLWQALAVLKERSVHDFDLGGINDESAQGVGTFKRGLGGASFETAGLFV
jgi:hypothetical protein